MIFEILFPMPGFSRAPRACSGLPCTFTTPRVRATWANSGALHFSLCRGAPELAVTVRERMPARRVLQSVPETRIFTLELPVPELAPEPCIFTLELPQGLLKPSIFILELDPIPNMGYPPPPPPPRLCLQRCRFQQNLLTNCKWTLYLRPWKKNPHCR